MMKVLKYFLISIFIVAVGVFLLNFNKIYKSGIFPKNNKPELNLIIVWEKSRFKEKEIIKDISKHLKILECYEIEWKPEYAINNFIRLYNFGEGAALYKKEEEGIGKFLLITALDENPKYGYDRTTVGIEYVNIKMLKLKNLYRKWVGGRFRIHATVKPEEVNHDLTLLLGINTEDYMKKTDKVSWDGKIIYLKRDLTGTESYSSMKEFLYTINSITNYAVLGLDGMDINNSKEIEILTDDYVNMNNVINKNLSSAKDKCKIGNEEIKINILSYKNDDYCQKEFSEIFSKRKKNNNLYTIDKNKINKKCIILK